MRLVCPCCLHDTREPGAWVCANGHGLVEMLPEDEVTGQESMDPWPRPETFAEAEMA